MSIVRLISVAAECQGFVRCARGGGGGGVEGMMVQFVKQVHLQKEFGAVMWMVAEVS